jgi:hypothetical protein
VPNACKSHAVPSGAEWRTAEEHVGICLAVGDNGPKGPLIPHTFPFGEESGNALPEEPAAHQIVGGVMAHQVNDGSLV